jgi:hypothetical protein
MSINTIKLTEDDVNRRQYLSKLFIEGKITLDQAKELRQILENERYMAIEDGNLQALYSMLTWIKAIDDFLTKKINIFENVSVGDEVSATTTKVSNV